MTASQHSASSALRQVGDAARRPPEMTVSEMFARTVQRSADKDALRYKKDKQYRSITYRELADRVSAFARGLISLGLGPGARMALLSENRPEWAIADLAALSIGSVNVPVYSTLPAPQVEFLVADSEAEVLVVSNEKQLQKALAIRDRLPSLKHIVVFDPPEPLPEGVLSLADLIERGRSVDPAAWTARRDAVRPADLATIIYTSGTTGAPKGAMLTHDNFMSNAQGAAAVFNIPADAVFLSFLPLSHVFERLAGHYFPLSVGATIVYAESVFTVQTNMVEVRPQVMCSVPRLYESMHSRILDSIAKLPERRRKLAEWALRVGWAHNERAFGGKAAGPILALQYRIADALVLKAIREKVSGGRILYFISGGAPLPLETGRFMISAGFAVIEGYGLTETSPVISFNPPGRIRPGTVGTPIAGVEIRVADDGEILSRGAHIMQGYFHQPEATAQAITPDGWFHTGDIGLLDEAGYLKITDRKKDIIVLANGKNVAPQPIEARLKASPYIENVVLFGDRQPNIVALIVPNLDHLRAWARERKLEERDLASLSRSKEVQKFYKAEIDRLSADLADFERVRRFTLLARDFSQDQDEITPTLKIKRRVVAEHFAGEIQAMYGASRAEA